METWGQTGRTPITSSRSGKDKSNPEPLLCLERIIPVSFFLWLGCRVSWSSTFPTMLRSAGMRDK